MRFIDFVIVVLLVGILSFILYWGIDKSEIVECLKLQNQAQHYPGFYLTEWQKDMCEAHAVEVIAIVKYK